MRSTGSDEWARVVGGRDKNHERVAFCPSGSVRLEVIESLADQDRSTLFVCKGRRSSARPNVVCHPYFDDYAGAIAGSDLVCLPFDLDHKVSGPAYEAVAAGKSVMVLPNAFGHHMKALFGEQILFPGEPLPSRTSSRSMVAYNDAIVRRWTELLHRGTCWTGRQDPAEQMRSGHGRIEEQI